MKPAPLVGRARITAGVGRRGTRRCTSLLSPRWRPNDSVGASK
jgi:hypothetical protein